MMRPGSAPFGGSSSTETTNFFPILRARGLFSSRGTGAGASFAIAGGSTVTTSRAGWSMRTERTRLRMCAGVVPQQPPTKVTPELMNRRAYDAMYSGVQR
jgi:hypothetical protein